MKVYDLDKLKTDDNQNGLYNFFDPTFKMSAGFPMSTYVVPPEHEMRIDLICKDIYGNTDNCDFLLDLNSIDNPLNIKENDSISYVDYEAIENYRVKVIDNKEARKALLNVNKTTRKDDGRKKYVEENNSIPPTYQESPQPAVQIVDNQIVIGG